jgi:uncharacterized protein involved in exopolysaccharide biosynthesis/Mrp family chromosome partitioning ATPase
MKSRWGASTTGAETRVRPVALSILRSLPVLLAVSALVAAATFFALGRLTPLYRAEARLLVEGADANQAPPASLLDGEAQVVRSRDIALTVIMDLGLAATPEYRKAIAAGGFLEDLRVALGLARDLSDAPDEERVLAHYDRRLLVRPSGAAAITIGFEAEDPEIAARAANAVATAYLALRRSATTETAAMLDAEVERLEAALAQAEQRLSALRDEMAALPPPLAETERSSLAAERDAAGQAAEDAEASAKAIRAALAAGSLPSSPAFLDDEAVRKLTDEQRALRAELAREMASNPLGNPRLAEIRGRLAAIEPELRVAAERVAVALEAAAAGDRTRAAEIGQRLEDADIAAAARDALAADIAKVKREIDDTRGRIVTAEKRRDALHASGIFAGEVRLLSRASVPTAPVWPDVLFGTVAAFFATLVLGSVIAAVRGAGKAQPAHDAPFEPLAEMALPEPAAAHFRRVEEPEVPRAPPPGEPSLAPAIERGGPSLATIADSISGQRRVVVTLAEDSDGAGRPLVAVALARSLAGLDRTVVLLDLRGDGADGMAMGEEADLPGFSDLLSGTVSFAQVIFRDRRSRAHFIAAGSEPVRPETLAGERLQTLLAALDHTYDHVVIDCTDDAIARIAPGADAALVASEHASADPRTVRAVSRIAKVSDARIFHLKVEPGRRPGDSDPERAAA